MILVPFPFTDLSAQKVRPAIILSSPRQIKKNVIVIFVSSVLPAKISTLEILVKDTNPSFKKTGLKRSSVIKCDKIATLDQNIVLGEIGEVDARLQKQINRATKSALGLS